MLSNSLRTRLELAKASAQARNGNPLVTNVIVGIIMGAIAIVIGVSLVSEVAFQADEAQTNASVTGATDTLVGLVPVIFVAGLIVSGFALFFTTRR